MYNENDYIEYYKNHLAHHGVKGQKWGVVHEKNRFDKQGRLIKKSIKKEDNNLIRKYEYESSTREDISLLKRQEEMQTHSINRKEANQKVKNGKSIIKAILVGGVLATAAVSTIIIKHKAKIAEGEARASRMMNKTSNKNAIATTKAMNKMRRLRGR